MGPSVNMEPSMKRKLPRWIRDRILRPWISPLTEGLIQFVFPRICPLCGTAHQIDKPLCPDCIDRLAVSRNPLVQSDAVDFSHLKGPVHFDCAATCWNFSTDIEALVHRVKYTGAPKLGRFLGEIAAEALRQQLPDLSDLLTPVPLHPVRFRERGFNQSEAIGRGMASRLGVRYVDNFLVRRKHTQTQTKLSAEARQKNVENAFFIGRHAQAAGRSFIVVDDVITTGATLNACAKTLKSAGAVKVVGLALARPRM
jgi:competence protein ComFC